MQTQKLSISLPKHQCDFIDNYQVENNYNSRSEVIREAINLLRQKQLEACYKEASQEVDTDFDITAADGLDDETW